MASYREAFTRDLHNEGIILELYDPAWQKTEHWFKILGEDSDAFQAAKAAQRARVLANSDPAAKAKPESEGDLNRELATALLVEWSFEEPCTRENVVELLKEAPHFLDQINKRASRALFWIQKKREKSSMQPEPDFVSKS